MVSKLQNYYQVSGIKLKRLQASRLQPSKYEGINKEDTCLKNDFSLNVRIMILGNMPFNSKHVQIDLKIDLTLF